MVTFSWFLLWLTFWSWEFLYMCMCIYVYWMWGNKTHNFAYLLLQDTLAMDSSVLTLTSVKWIMEAVVSLHWCSASTLKYSNWFLVCSCYSRIKSAKSPKFYMTIFSMNPTNLAALLPQSLDCSWCISRCIVAPSPLWLQKHTDVCLHYCTYSSNLYYLTNWLTLPAFEGGDYVELLMI